MNCFDDYIKSYICDLHSKKLYRDLIKYDDSYTDFSSNDYLGLCQNRESILAGVDAAIKYGSGSSGSRLLSGNKEIFEIFENEIAITKKFNSSLIFNSGFSANMSVISSLCALPNVVIFFDKLNHASMYEGARLMNVIPIRYRHLDYNQLEDLLKKNIDIKNKIIVSETVFGMDGDIADLNILSCLSQKYNAILFLDEAHATGIYGQNGYGISSDFSLLKEKTIIMGTFSKALASSGAYVVCSDTVKDYLIQKSKSFIYSTALSPFCIGVAMYNWNLIKSMENIRRSIMDKAESARSNMRKIGYNVIGNGTNIISILFKETQDVIKMKEKMLHNGIVVSAIRRPTSNTPRIRIAINATHSEDDIKKLWTVNKSGFLEDFLGGLE